VASCSARGNLGRVLTLLDNVEDHYAAADTFTPIIKQGPAYKVMKRRLEVAL
jgi:hypothetical protein